MSQTGLLPDGNKLEEHPVQVPSLHLIQLVSILVHKVLLKHEPWEQYP